MGVCNCSMFCCTLLYVHSSIAIILMGKRELIALLNLSSWCLVMVERLFLAVPRGCLQLVIVVFPDHTHLPFLRNCFPVNTFLTVFQSRDKLISILFHSHVTCCTLMTSNVLLSSVRLGGSFVRFDSLRTSQQLYSYVAIEPLLSKD